MWQGKEEVATLAAAKEESLRCTTKDVQGVPVISGFEDECCARRTA
jgi:hypothetical protein